MPSDRHGPIPLLHDHLQHGSALVLLDGVDEVPLVHGSNSPPCRPRAMILSGLAAGTGMGVWVSSFFIPHLQVGNDMAAHIPPFLVSIDWSAVFQVYILFAILFVIALGALVWLLLRMKIFEAIKLGEAV